MGLLTALRDSPTIARVAPGLVLLGHRSVNCYLVEQDGRIGLVDAGLPATRPVLLAALAELGRRPADLEAVVVTHGHFDHLGMARWLHADHGVPVLAHEADGRLMAAPYHYRPQRNRVAFAARHPGGWPHLASMSAAGALTVRPPSGFTPLREGVLDSFPGSPRVLHTPGHTDGHAVLHFPGADAVVTGDALVTLDPYTGRRGPRLVATGATSDPVLATDSLGAIAATGAATVLPGHGRPWYDGAAEAARRAAEAGAA